MGNTANDGYIKYDIILTEGPPPEHEKFEELNAFRTELYRLNMIGFMEEQGIGFGNLSHRVGDTEQFIITGTATGKPEVLDVSGYSLVTSFDVEQNTVHCTGKVKTSSETMTHGVIYQAKPEIRCVAHVHHTALWLHLLKQDGFITPEELTYGTPELARAIFSIVESCPDNAGIITMEGHDDGVIAYGPDIATTRQVLLDVYHQIP